MGSWESTPARLCPHSKKVLEKLLQRGVAKGSDKYGLHNAEKEGEVLGDTAKHSTRRNANFGTSWNRKGVLKKKENHGKARRGVCQLETSLTLRWWRQRLSVTLNPANLHLEVDAENRLRNLSMYFRRNPGHRQRSKKLWLSMVALEVFLYFMLLCVVVYFWQQQRPRLSLTQDWDD